MRESTECGYSLPTLWGYSVFALPLFLPLPFLPQNALAGEGAVEEFIEAALPGVLMPFMGLVRGLRLFPFIFCILQNRLTFRPKVCIIELWRRGIPTRHKSIHMKG